METIWEISAADTDIGFALDDWLKVIETRSELQRIPPVTRPNPFKPGELMEVSAPGTSVNVFIDEECVGSICWAMDESTLLNASPESGKEGQMLPIVEAIASELKASVTEHRFD